jgi:hypothetical protein
MKQGGNMLYLIVFTILAGLIASLVFFLIYKRHVKKYGAVKEKSFTLNAPEIFGSINIILAVVFLVWYIVNPDAFSADTTIENKILYILFSIFAAYFYIFAMPLSIASVFSSIALLKKNGYISGTKFVYCVLTNIIATSILFIISYLVLSQTGR